MTQGDPKAFAKLLGEASNAEIRAQAERDLLNDIKKRMVDEHGIKSKKIANRIIKAFHKGTFNQEEDENENFEQAVTLLKNKDST